MTGEIRITPTFTRSSNGQVTLSRSLGVSLYLVRRDMLYMVPNRRTSPLRVVGGLMRNHRGRKMNYRRRRQMCDARRQNRRRRHLRDCRGQMSKRRRLMNLGRARTRSTQRESCGHQEQRKCGGHWYGFLVHAAIAAMRGLGFARRFGRF